MSVADGFSVEFRGFKEIDQALADLGPIAGERIMRASLMEAVKPIEERVHQGLSFVGGSGALSKATRRVYLRGGSKASGGIKASATRFVVAVAPKVKDPVAIALANLKYRRKKPIRGIFWGHLLEWGHRVGNRSSGRLNRSKNSTRLHTGFGRVRGLRIFTKAFEGGSLEATTIFRRVIGQKVAAALKRARKITRK
jgi:hypothetical protein